MNKLIFLGILFTIVGFRISDAQSLDFKILNTNRYFNDKDIEISPIPKVKDRTKSYKIITTSINIIGDTSGYLIKLSQSFSNTSDLLSTVTSGYHNIVLIDENAELFKKVVNKYFEWYNKAKEKDLELTKDIYSTTDTTNLLFSGSASTTSKYGYSNKDMLADVFAIPNDTNIVDISYNYQFIITYDKDVLRFMITKKAILAYKDGTHKTKTQRGHSIELRYQDLKEIQKLIKNGTYDSYIKKCKDASKIWDEFEGL